jgi:multidrug resistance efflux pump
MLAYASQQSTLLTGIVTSAENHLVTAPKTNRWQVQIQWMADEGSIVNKGDLVAVFDSGGIEAQLEQNEEKLITEQLELLKAEMDLQQAVVEAEGKLTLANILVDKTRIEASVPDGEISAYEKGKSLVEYEKVLMEKIKAEQGFKLRKEELKVGVDKQEIEILKLEENIAYQKSQIDKLSVRSKVTGPVSHMMHQWMAQKVAIGMNIQASWKVLMVQALSAYQVTAWVHEIDAARLDLQGSDISLSFDAYPNVSYQGKLIEISSQAENKSQWSDSAYYRIQIAFKDTIAESVYPGMSVRVELDEKVKAVGQIGMSNDH